MGAGGTALLAPGGAENDPELEADDDGPVDFKDMPVNFNEMDGN